MRAHRHYDDPLPKPGWLPISYQAAGQCLVDIASPISGTRPRVTMHNRQLFCAASAVLLASSLAGAVAASSTANAALPSGPTVTHLTEFGNDDFVAGSTIGPDGALYVTDGAPARYCASIAVTAL